jgi:hypothetical protein
MSILNINNGGGSGSYIRFMPSANAWVLNKEEVTLDAIVFDHESIKSGWGKMMEGSAPEWQWDERLGVQGQIPSQERDAKGQLLWKRGFSINFYSKQHGVVEWSSTGTGPVIGFDQIFEEIWNAKDANPGMVPVCKYGGSAPLKVGKGNTRVPNFSLAKWVKRDSIPWDADEAEQAPAQAPKPAPAPVQAKKAAPAPADDDLDF